MVKTYLFKSNYLNLRGLKYHYIDEGNGQPLVMLHGNPTWSFYYRNLIKGLKDSYRTIVPDHIGCGYSDKPNDINYNYSLSRRVADLEQLINYLKIKSNITLILHDWGGMIGMTFANMYPERIKRIIILNTAAFHLPESKKFPFILKLCKLTIVGPLLVRFMNLFCLSAVYFCVKKPMLKEIRKEYLSPYNTWKNRIAILRFIQDIPIKTGDSGYDLISNVQRELHLFKNKPMLICWGEKDFIFDNHFLNEWIHLFPDAEVHRFSNAGHYVLEDVGDKILPLIKNFLKES